MKEEWILFIQKYTLPGARKMFQHKCYEIFIEKYPKIETIREYPGDQGIDFYYLDEDGKMIVFECKFFHDKIAR